MDETGSTDRETLSLPMIRQVDAACDRFEAALRAGEEPRIEAYLDEVPAPARSALRHELLVLHLELPTSIWHWRAGAARPNPAGYEIIGEIGRGGMGVVYKARQRSLNRLVALKMSLDGGHANLEQLARFRIEADAVARLSHSNIVEIHEIGESDGHPFLALELLEGGSLADRIAGTPQPVRQAAELMVTLSRAVHAAHRAGIVHRDLKPANVLFDRDGTPKITDFGLAKRLEVKGELTAIHQVIGTPSYMAPEQADGRNREIGPAADLYALGAILYDLLTGRPPFHGTAPLAMVMLADPVSPSRLQPKVPRDLETICLKCLEKVPSRRYADAQALADDLGRFLADEPIHARRTPAWERVLKWSRRRPTAASMAAFGLIALVGLVAGLLWHDASVRAEARREEGRVARLRLEAGDGLLKGREQLARGELDESRVTLTQLLAEIHTEPRLADLRGRAAGVLDQVRRGLGERAAREADRARLARFAELRDASLFLDIQHPDLELGGRREEARTSARAALATFTAGGEDDAWSLAPLPASYSAAEREEVASGCYLMLMVLAEAVARPLPGEDPRHQAAAALHILERGAALRPSTRAYRIRRAACLERAGDAEAARRERRGRTPGADRSLRPLPARPGVLPAWRLDGGPAPLRCGDPGAARPVLGPVPLGRLLPELLSVAPGRGQGGVDGLPATAAVLRLAAPAARRGLRPDGGARP